MGISVDLNCDMGEGMLNDAAIMPYITSVNIACGYHAGNETIMQQTIELALAHNAKIGAHPSFPDIQNFGRTNMNFLPDEVHDMVNRQIELLSAIASKNNCHLHHVKPHGALYNMASKDENLASAICNAIIEINPDLQVYAQSGSALIKVAAGMGLKTCNEVFADRTYQPDGTLTPRTDKNALLHNEEEVIAHVLQMVQKQTVLANGEEIPVKADTICVHGDGEHALNFIKRIHDTLQLNNIKIQPIL